MLPQGVRKLPVNHLYRIETLATPGTIWCPLVLKWCPVVPKLCPVMPKLQQNDAKMMPARNPFPPSSHPASNQSTSHQSLQKRGRRQWAKPLGSAAPCLRHGARRVRYLSRICQRQSLEAPPPPPYFPFQILFALFCYPKTASKTRP